MLFVAKSAVSPQFQEQVVALAKTIPPPYVQEEAGFALLTTSEQTPSLGVLGSQLMGQVVEAVTDEALATRIRRLFLAPEGSVGLAELIRYPEGGGCPFHCDCIEPAVVCVISVGHSATFWAENEPMTVRRGDAVLFDGSTARGFQHRVSDVVPESSNYPGPDPGFRYAVQIRAAAPRKETDDVFDLKGQLDHGSSSYSLRSLWNVDVWNAYSPLKPEDPVNKVAHPLLHLSDDVLGLVARQCDVRSLGNMSLTCRRLNRVSYESLKQRQPLSLYGDFSDAPVCIDMGSLFLRYGFGGTDAPRTQRSQLSMDDFSGMAARRNGLIGNSAWRQPNLSRLIFPVESGVVTNFDSFANVLQETFCSFLGISPENHPVLTSEPLLNPKANREKVTQIMFETFQVPAYYTTVSVTSAMYAHGRTVGLSCNAGFGLVETVLVYEGYALPHSAICQDIVCGKRIAADLSHLLKIEFRLALDLLPQLGLDMTSPTTFQLCTGPVVVENPRAFLEPYYRHIAEQLLKTAMKAELDIRDDCLQAICLFGGLFDVSGSRDLVISILRDSLDERWARYIKLLPLDYRSRDAVWTGLSILGSLSTFKGMYIRKEEYDECGPSLVHRKCF